MKILILASLLASINAFAFNWQRCSFSQPVSGQGGGLLQVSSTFVTNVGISSSQFMSSWGECSMVGEIQNVRRTFIAQNLPYLMQDIAKGSGEYLSAYARLHDCNTAGNSQYGRVMKQQYAELTQLDFEGIFLLMEAPFTEMKSVCST
jgi:hypothetical protein